MNLTRIREMRGLSQRALGEMIGKDAATVNRAEAMHKSATLLTYRKCAEALDVKLIDLFTDDRTVTEMELIRVFRRVPKDRHAEFLAILRMAENRVAPEGEETAQAGHHQAD